jgi:hypothetical protein
MKQRATDRATMLQRRQSRRIRRRQQCIRIRLHALLRAANAAIRAGITEDQAKLAGFEIIEKQSAA